VVVLLAWLQLLLLPRSVACVCSAAATTAGGAGGGCICIIGKSVMVSQNTLCGMHTVARMLSTTIVQN
jgi:hypothetical protein